MRTETEIREKLAVLLTYNHDELVAQRTDKYPHWRDDSIANRTGIIFGLCWALGYESAIDFMESEVRAGRASLGADLDAKIKAKQK
jgi:hypothetical protein